MCALREVVKYLGDRRWGLLMKIGFLGTFPLATFCAHAASRDYFESSTVVALNRGDSTADRTDSVSIFEPKSPCKKWSSATEAEDYIQNSRKLASKGLLEYFKEKGDLVLSASPTLRATSSPLNLEFRLTARSRNKCEKETRALRHKAKSLAIEIWKKSGLAVRSKESG